MDILLEPPIGWILSLGLMIVGLVPVFCSWMHQWNWLDDKGVPGLIILFNCMTLPIVAIPLGIGIAIGAPGELAMVGFFLMWLHGAYVWKKGGL